MAVNTPEITIADEDGTIAPEFIQAVSQAAEAHDKAQLDNLIAKLHEADLADLIELLAPGIRRDFIAMLGEDLNFSALSELDREQDRSLDLTLGTRSGFGGDDLPFTRGGTSRLSDMEVKPRTSENNTDISRISPSRVMSSILMLISSTSSGGTYCPNRCASWRLPRDSTKNPYVICKAKSRITSRTGPATGRTSCALVQAKKFVPINKITLPAIINVENRADSLGRVKVRTRPMRMININS